MRGLTIQYRGASEPALQGLDFQIPQGSFFGLLGPNGAGKTTLISFLCGQVEGGYSSAHVLGVDRSDLRGYKRRLGYAPQEVALYPSLSAAENLQFFSRLLETSREDEERVLDWVGLTDNRNKKVAAFSGGMKRRLNLAVALLNKPQLLILDEPTVGVDPQSRNFIFEKLLELKKQGVTLLYSTHYLEEVKRLCDQVAILQNGKCIASGDRDSLFGTGDLEQRYLELTGKEVE